MRTVTLRSGEEMEIRVVEPPMGDYADQVGCWRDVREDLLGGVFKPWLFTPYFIGEIDGSVAGSMSYYVSRECRNIGVVEFVHTDEAHRQKGIGSHLMSALIEQFHEDGGKALYLCTSNSVAGHLYERHGFRYHVGDGMRYLSPGEDDFDAVQWAHCGQASVRDAHWGDLADLSALYNHPEPRWQLKDYLTQTFADTRYESHFIRLMRRIEDGRGSYVVLETPSRKLVGAAAFERLDTFYEQHVATMGFRVTPAYVDQVGELFDAACERAAALSVRTLQVPVSASDEDEAELLQSAGFCEEGRLPNRLRTDRGWSDLLIYGKTFTASSDPVRPSESYYGLRKGWQEEKVGSE